MRILMVAPTPFFADRGCHVRILGEIQGLQALGHEVLLCTYPLGRDVAGVRTVRTMRVPWYRKLSAGPSWHKYYIDVLLVELVHRWIRRWKPDLIHAHLHEGGCVAVLALRRRPLPLVLDYQGSLTDEVVAHRFTRTGTLQHRWLAKAETWIERRADAIITSTSSAREGLARDQGISPNRVFAVTDGVDVEQFRPGRNGHSVRERYRIAPGIPLIIYTGLLNTYQGIDLLMEALSLLARSGRAFHALLVGYPNIEEYRAMAKRLNVDDRVTLTGRVAFEAIPEFLAASDIAVSPKLPGSEGNLKLYTYLAAGLPTVAFETPLNREVIEESGLLVSRVEADSLAEGLAAMLDRRAEWLALGRLARQRAVEQFSWRSVAQRIEQVYGQLSATTKGCES